MAVVAGGEECLQGGEHPQVWQGEVVEEQVEEDEEKKGSSGRRIERDTLRAFRHHKQVHPLVSANCKPQW